MVNWKVVGLAVYALALIIAGVYGYVASTSAQNISYDLSLCFASTGPDSLPPCLPSETLSETGSALMYPLFNLWIQNFTRLYPNVGINTQNTGSGEGQAYVEQGIVQIGGSSAFLTDDQVHANTMKGLNILNIPLAVTADIMDYNIIITNSTNPPVATRWADLPACKANAAACRLNFTAPLLSQIYSAQVHYWNDTPIKKINPGAASFLPYEPIWATYRSDAAGDTLFFTQYLSSGDAWWNTNVGSGLTVAWPNCIVNATVPSCPQSALGNPGIVIATGARAGALSYVSVEALDQWVLCDTGSSLCSGYAPLDYGLLQNRAGKFVEATPRNIQYAIGNATTSQIPSDERFPLANAPGLDSYPIVGFGYALVNVQQISREFALVLRTFLRFCLLQNYGASPGYLSVYHFAPLPSQVTQLSLNQTAMIGPS